MSSAYFYFFEMHNKDNLCSMCHGYKENYVYTYEKMYKRCTGHLRHLHVYEYHRRGKQDMTEYNAFIRYWQNIGFFGPMAQSHLWITEVDDRTGYLLFKKW